MYQVTEADRVLEALVSKRKDKCEKEGKEFVPVYVLESKDNTAKCIRVPAVFC